jgi:hypothetical protein
MKLLSRLKFARCFFNKIGLEIKRAAQKINKKNPLKIK